MGYNRRAWLGAVGVGLLLGSAQAQSEGTLLQESLAVGSTFQYEISLAIEGQMKVARDGRAEGIPLQAKASHRFVERVETPDARGGIGRSLRHYELAKSESTTGPDRQTRELPDARRLIVVQRSATGSLHYCPEGPLSREELELVAEHFDPYCLTGLLPGKPVKIDETWPIDAETVQYACLFEGLLKHELTGKLVSIEGGIAKFSITGTAEGVESGAMCKLSISAVGQFDLTAKRITELLWEQTDERQQGPVSPNSEFKAVVRVKRSLVTEEPKELSATVRAKFPAEPQPSAQLLQLSYTDSQNRYQIRFSRDWYIVGKTPDHLVMRLLDNGELTAQATISAWRRSEPGKHLPVEDFKKLVAMLPGWQQEQLLSDGTIPSDGGRWLYRLVAQGKQDNIPVVQLFYLLAGPNGDQVAVTVLTNPEKASKLQGREAALVQAIDFAGKR